jgi:hypothetical protein
MLSVEYGVHEQDELYKSMMNIIIRASIKECGGSWEKVFELVKEKFSSTNEQAEEYMKLYW